MKASTSVRLLPLCMLLAGGCGDANVLDGSIGAILSLDFSDVRVLVQPDSMRIEYVRTRDAYVFKVCTVAVDRTSLVGGFNFIADEDFRRYVSIGRVVDDEEAFPKVRSGFIEIEDLDLSFEREIRGEFAVEFVDGRTLKGQFEAEPTVLDP